MKKQDEGVRFLHEEEISFLNYNDYLVDNFHWLEMRNRLS